MVGKLPSSDISWITLPRHVHQQTNALQYQFEQSNMEGKLPSSDISSWITLVSHEQQQTNALQHQFEQFNMVGKLLSSDTFLDHTPQSCTATNKW